MSVSKRVSAWLALCVVLTGCVHGIRRSPRQVSGTCEGACTHYVACKSTDDQRLHQSCVSECKEIFVDQGDVDRESLRDYERLECTDAVAFVEGSPGRHTGL